MLAEIGEMLGFYVKREESTTDGLHRFDITWRDHSSHSPVKVWEVEISGNVLTALARLKHALDLWHPELYLVVSDAKTKEKAEELVKPQIKSAFAERERSLTVTGADTIINLYNGLKPNKDIILKLAKKTPR
jgi:hypothetical protein